MTPLFKSLFITKTGSYIWANRVLQCLECIGFSYSVYTSVSLNALEYLNFNKSNES